MFFLFIITSVLILFWAIHTFKVEINVEELIINTEANKILNDEYKIYLYLVVFNKIKLFRINVKKIDFRKLKFLNNNIDIKFLKNKEIKLNYKEIFENIKIDIKEIELQIQISIQDAATNAIIAGIVSALLGIIIKKPKYEVIPIYANKNFLKINLNCIISIYLMQYIYKLIYNKFSDLRKRILGQKVEV
ncbi:MAG: DUF2953 domain-containing protein [Clostridia bacterium]|nr:DUF2953 domain-containing protein [Clostridia bacterium]